MNSCKNCEYWKGSPENCTIPSEFCPKSIDPKPSEDLATYQAEKMIEAQEREISKLETDYTGEYRRGL